MGLWKVGEERAGSISSLLPAIFTVLSPSAGVGFMITVPSGGPSSMALAFKEPRTQFLLLIPLAWWW